MQLSPGETREEAAVTKVRSHTRHEQQLRKDFRAKLNTSESSEDVRKFFVNAFRDFRGVPDRQALIKETGIDSDRIHIKLGEPEKVIVDQARALDASLVVVGNSARSGLAAAVHGNTVEKILDKLDCDILTMP